MIRRLVIVAGLVCGFLLGIAALALNPFGYALPSGPVGAASLTLAYEPNEFRGFEFTPVALLGIAGFGGAFDDAGIRYARADVVTLTVPGSGAVALGVRLSSVARQNSLLRAQLGVVADWSIVVPGQGSMVLAGSENFWPVARDCLWSLLRGHGFAPTAAQYAPGAVAGTGTGQAVAGARGAFAGARGGFRETYAPLEGRGSDLGGQRTIQVTQAPR